MGFLHHPDSKWIGLTHNSTNPYLHSLLPVLVTGICLFQFLLIYFTFGYMSYTTLTTSSAFSSHLSLWIVSYCYVHNLHRG